MAGSTALLVGAGPIGIGAWYAFRVRGVEQVLVSEPNAERRAAIATLDATAIDPVTEDLAQAAAEMTVPTSPSAWWLSASSTRSSM